MAGRRQRPIVSPGFIFMLVIVGLVVSNASQRRFVPTVGSQEDRVTVFSVMGRDSRTSDAANFRGAEMTTVMGRAELDLRRAAVAPGTEAVIDVSAVMGRVEVLVPKEWTVQIDTTPIMGAVRDVRGLDPEELRRFRRSGRRGDRDLELPAAAAPPEAPGPAAAPASNGPPPRVVIRGFVMMGAVVVRS